MIDRGDTIRDVERFELEALVVNIVVAFFGFVYAVFLGFFGFK